MRLSLRLGFLSILTAALLMASGLVAGASPAAPSGHGHDPAKYVAVGDSYAAGQGGGPYLNGCKQTRAGYPSLLDIAGRIQLVANASCSGATTTDVTAQTLGLVKAGLLSTRTDLVTVTVGGDDLNTAAIAAACGANPTSAQCLALIAQAQALLAPGASGGPSVLATRLATTLGAIAAAAPAAEILVTGYPVLFETPPPTDPRFPLITQVNAAAAALDATISGVVAQIHLAGPNIVYVDVAGLFAGHGVGSTRPWIIATGPDALHPNALGYLAYTGALLVALLKNGCHAVLASSIR